MTVEGKLAFPGLEVGGPMGLDLQSGWPWNSVSAAGTLGYNRKAGRTPVRTLRMEARRLARSRRA